MAKHEIKFTVPASPLSKEPIEFKVQEDSGVLGKLRISKGRVLWVPKNQKYGHWFNWREFDEVMQEKGKREKHKKVERRE